MNRREFLESSAAAAAGVGVFGWPRPLAAQMPDRQNINSTLFADLTPEQTTEITYRLQQYTSEVTLDKLPTAGLSADYVRRETRRAVTGVGAAGRTKIWPGIEIDVPTGDREKKTTPDDVYAAVKATFEGGANGIILSRKYSEMRLDNLRAAGRAIRETIKRA
jgi:hypothetical protein